MPNTREKLIEIFESAERPITVPHRMDAEQARKYVFGEMADHLIANGVTVRELDGCCRCKDTSEMTVTISNKLVDGVRTGWLGGNLPARYCPFCGRRLP